MRYSPGYITDLPDNTIFVFGSNKLGLHYGGAARVAYDKFGAEWGNPFGLQGSSFAIPTIDEKHEQVSISELTDYVNRFIGFAKQNPGLRFWVTEIGCGIAGFKPEEISPLFKDAKDQENIYMPNSFWK